MDRFDIVLGHYVFCTLHHEGQGSDLYARLSRISGYFEPGPLFSEARFLDPEVSGFEGAREVYRALCQKHGVPDSFAELDQREAHGSKPNPARDPRFPRATLAGE